MTWKDQKDLKRPKNEFKKDLIRTTKKKQKKSNKFLKKDLKNTK